MRSKYRNKRTEVDNISFHSRKEAARYKELCILLRIGQIKDLQLQPRFPLYVNNVKICTYVADFRYTTADGKTVIEDAKGMATQTYKLKRKLFDVLYAPLRIVET